MGDTPLLCHHGHQGACLWTGTPHWETTVVPVLYKKGMCLSLITRKLLERRVHWTIKPGIREEQCLKVFDCVPWRTLECGCHIKPVQTCVDRNSTEREHSLMSGFNAVYRKVFVGTIRVVLPQTRNDFSTIPFINYEHSRYDVTLLLTNSSVKA